MGLIIGFFGARRLSYQQAEARSGACQIFMGRFVKRPARSGILTCLWIVINKAHRTTQTS